MSAAPSSDAGGAITQHQVYEWFQDQRPESQGDRDTRDALWKEQHEEDAQAPTDVSLWANKQPLEVQNSIRESIAATAIFHADRNADDARFISEQLSKAGSRTASSKAPSKG